MAGTQVMLVGVDVGTTTTSCLLASAAIVESPVTGQTVLDCFVIESKNGPILTPYHIDDASLIDRERLTQFIKESLRHPLLDAQPLFSSGALITGLAAKRANIAEVQADIKALMKDVVMVTADDPHYESWLAFMGNALTISSAYPDVPVMNIDIGGGTTNIALGLNGQVLATGSYYIGARHFQFVPGTYQFIRASKMGRQILDYLSISAQAGTVLSQTNIEAIVDFYYGQLASVVHKLPVFEPLLQAPLELPEEIDMNSCIVTFSGGVGELIYQYHLQQATPLVSGFGDLGERLAERICYSSLFGQSCYQQQEIIPESLGKSTLFGLTFHSAHLSGSTVFLAKNIELPLEDIPIVGEVKLPVSPEALYLSLSLVQNFSAGAAFQIAGDVSSAEQVLALGEQLKQVLSELALAANYPLVFLTNNNIGHSLGSLVTEWRTVHPNVFVFDELPSRAAKMLHVGHPKNHVVPIHYYAFGTQHG